MMTLEAAVLLALKASIVLSVFAVGLDAQFQDALYLVRRPSLLVRSLVAMDVVMPVVVAMIVEAFRLHPAIEIVLVALAVSPVPPLPPQKTDRGARRPVLYGRAAAVPIGVHVLRSGLRRFA
jgi:bile acid:Na+ symporter, BASS family